MGFKLVAVIFYGNSNPESANGDRDSNHNITFLQSKIPFEFWEG